MSLTNAHREPEKTLAAWHFLLTPPGEALVTAASLIRSDDVTAVGRLRREWTAPQVAAALELTEARRRGAQRFEDIDQLVADRTGLEQASSTPVARYKAQRLARAGCRSVWDLCCGIGGDARELSRVMSVVGVDHDPLKCWMTETNAGCPTQCENVLDLPIPPGAIHIDPSRRTVGQARRHDPAAWSPTALDLCGLLQGRTWATVKMGPGIDPARLPFLQANDEIEFISVEGSLVQAVLWRTPDMLPRRRATGLWGERIETLTGAGDDLPEHQPPRWAGRWLHVPDPAVERAQLLGVLARAWDLSEPARGLGLLLGDQPADSPWLAAYAVEDAMPWRLERIQAWLQAHDAGTIEVRTRGGALAEVDALRERLRGSGTTAWTIFGLRLDQTKVAVMTRPRGVLRREDPV